MFRGKGGGGSGCRWWVVGGGWWWWCLLCVGVPCSRVPTVLPLTVYRGLLDRLGQPQLDDEVLQATYDYIRRLIASDKIRTNAQVRCAFTTMRAWGGASCCCFLLGGWHEAVCVWVAPWFSAPLVCVGRWACRTGPVVAEESGVVAWAHHAGTQQTHSAPGPQRQRAPAGGLRKRSLGGVRVLRGEGAGKRDRVPGVPAAQPLGGAPVEYPKGAVRRARH